VRKEANLPKALVNFGIAMVILLIVVIIIGALGLDPWKGPRRLFYKEQEITKQTIEAERENRKATADVLNKTCFTHQVWHAAWLNGGGDKNTALLVAVTTRNAKENPKAPTDYCTLFTAGGAELPSKDKRTKETENSYIYRKVEIVSGQSSTKARTVQYDAAEEIVEKVLATPNYRALLPEELSKAKCARKFLRKKFGWLISWSAGSREEIRKALVVELGDPVHTAPDGMEFFGTCPQ
jgi:hypothetical protein